MQNLYQRLHSPFDDSAIERLRRMGLATTDGQADMTAMNIFSRIFAGQFFDDLCDYCQDYKDVSDRMAQLFHAAERAVPKQKFLLICLQYDAMLRTLPDPVWWISGTPDFAELFAEGFISHLKRLEQTTGGSS